MLPSRASMMLQCMKRSGLCASTSFATGGWGSAEVCSTSGSQWQPAGSMLDGVIMKSKSTSFLSLLAHASSSLHPSSILFQQQAIVRQYSSSQNVPYSKRSGTPTPSPWPVFETIKLSKAGAVKWQRSLYRFPPEVDIKMQHEDRIITLSGLAGSITLNLTQLDPSGLMAFRMIHLPKLKESTSETSQKNQGTESKESILLALASPDKARFDAFIDELDASVRGVTTGYLVGVTVKGVGYRMEPMNDAPRRQSWYFEDDSTDRSATVFPHPTPVRAVRLKVGYSRTAIFPIPKGIRAFCIKPTLLYLYGLRKEEVSAVAAQLRSVRRPNVYTGNGIQLMDEVVRIKQRKASK